MSSRELVIQHVTQRMMVVFTHGDLIDAQNLNCFLASLEGMSDQEYERCVGEEIPGAIS